MKKTLTIIIFVVLAVLIGLMIAGIVRQKEEVVKMDERDQAIQDENTTLPQTIDVKHQYRDGTHIFVGTVDVPTPCHGLETDVTREDELYTIAFTIQNNEPDACAQVITPTIYTVEVEAPVDASFIMTIDGEVVNVNQFEVPPAQDIYQVDILNKG